MLTQHSCLLHRPPAAQGRLLKTWSDSDQAAAAEQGARLEVRLVAADGEKQQGTFNNPPSQDALCSSQASLCVSFGCPSSGLGSLLMSRVVYPPAGSRRCSAGRARGAQAESGSKHLTLWIQTLDQKLRRTHVKRSSRGGLWEIYRIANRLLFFSSFCICAAIISLKRVGDCEEGCDTAVWYWVAHAACASLRGRSPEIVLFFADYEKQYCCEIFDKTLIDSIARCAVSTSPV